LMTLKAAFAAASSSNISQAPYEWHDYACGPDNEPNEEGRSDEANGPVFHLSIHMALNIVPAIDKIMTPAVCSMIVSMRFRRALICSYLSAQISS
jgi:hypothetical protein